MELKNYLLENEYLKLEVLNIGCAIHRLWVKDASGKFRDVVLGYESMEDYLKNSNTYFGVVVGRNANRIAHAQVEIEGKNYQLEANEGENTLHSGLHGFHERIWQVEKQSPTAITFVLHSPHLDQGFPGNLDMKVTYQLNENQMTITYEGESDATTIFNPTNHAYFNLNGHKSGDIEGHQLQISAQTITSIMKDTLIPTGKFMPVIATPFDFNQRKTVKQALGQTHEQLTFAGGIDHNFILDQSAIIRLLGDESGIELSVCTDLPGVQVYTGNFIENESGKDDIIYQKHAGICLETQFFPDTPHNAQFPTSLIAAHTPTKHWTSYTFTNQKNS
ncbi:aldose epimerase family protein [uncultured Enterococcus sp.]|uniref:aldose epimerase family protein n=1 Tax=uncultured Enterococcus sp. TaxID=167972 RepID=UPI00261EB5BF|nr:aldose epimerase family protein [uncultured Enterococcus sp.]